MPIKNSFLYKKMSHLKRQFNTNMKTISHKIMMKHTLVKTDTPKPANQSVYAENKELMELA